MQLTLQAEDIHQFNRIIRWIIKKPRYMTAHFAPFRDKLALAVHSYDWSIVMPLQGRKPIKPFKIQYKYLQGIPANATDKIIIRIRPEKGLGDIQWLCATGWKFSDPFLFGIDGFSVTRPPMEAPELKEYPVAFLDDIWRCTRIALNPNYPRLHCVRIGQDGELWSSDGRRALGIQSGFTFDCEEKMLVRACELFGKREIRKTKNLRMGFCGRSVHFDFGEFHFWTAPQVEKYPDLSKTFPKEETLQTRLTLDPADVAFLKKHLDDLPGKMEHDAPVTLLCDYGGSVSVHGSQDDRDKTKGILLARSSYEGDAYVLQMNRKYLLHALSLGCLDFRFGTSYPLGLKENIRYCWIQIDGGALPLESERPSPPVVLLRSDQPITTKGKI